MNDMLEATQENVDECIKELGTYYFVCPDFTLARLRAMIIQSTKGTGVHVHTSHNTVKRSLRVVFTRG